MIDKFSEELWVTILEKCEVFKDGVKFIWKSVGSGGIVTTVDGGAIVDEEKD